VLVALHAPHGGHAVHVVGVATMTASMFLLSLSSICRKSRYVGLRETLYVAAARRSSTSQSATMFSVGAAARMLLAPWPPEPMAAKFSFCARQQAAKEKMPSGYCHLASKTLT
jgi:hypothetical protein